MTKTRAIQTAATILALYGAGGAFVTNSGREWTMFAYPLAVIAVATLGPLNRAVASAFTFSLSALCAMIAWRALGRGSADWFLTHYAMMSLFWAGMSALTAAPLFETVAAEPELAAEPASLEEPEAELEPA
jgi:hypothetical protein